MGCSDHLSVGQVLTRAAPSSRAFSVTSLFISSGSMVRYRTIGITWHRVQNLNTPIMKATSATTIASLAIFWALCGSENTTAAQ